MVQSMTIIEAREITQIDFPAIIHIVLEYNIFHGDIYIFSYSKPLVEGVGILEIFCSPPTQCPNG